MKKLLTLLLLTLSGAALCADPAVDPREPDQIILETTETLRETVNERRAEFENNPELLKRLVNRDMLPLIDTGYSARLILGRAGRGASPEQVDRFAAAISNVLLARYADGLLEFRDGGQFEVLPLKGENSERMTRVRTRVYSENGTFTPVDFAFRKTETGWKAFDVTVEGISYVMTYRNQIGPRVTEVGIDQVSEDIESGKLSLED
jgi:phospholipid transport system substrate-binding protein